jgi:5-methylcytosine-specific restriction endonuclease McrA
MKNWNENLQIRGAIRRVFARSPIVKEMRDKVRREVPKYNKDGQRAKRDAVQYLCNECKNWVGSTKISVDHIDPVIQEHGFVDWNCFVGRVFCASENLQVICDGCHQKKTNAERLVRKLRVDLVLLAGVESDLRIVTADPLYDRSTLNNTMKKFTKKRLEGYTPEMLKIVAELKVAFKGLKKVGA